MKKTITIRTGTYEKPLTTTAIYSENGSIISFKWSEKSSEDNAVSLYLLELDRENGTVTVTREGEVKSRMVFDTSRTTTAAFTTPYGLINMDIITRCIRLPSILESRIEIEYEIVGTGENIFTIVY